MAETNSRRIVVLGKTGAGKSSIGNTIFGGERQFKVNASANSGTKICESNTKEVNGRNIKLIDTPGLFDTDPNSTELSPELLRCITECAPGPHAFLLVLRLEKFTKQEQDIVALILKYFSEEALKYTTVVFTHGDDLPEGVMIREWANENDALRNLVDKCGGRCHVLDNKYWKNSQDQYRNNQVQVKELLETIETTVRENKGECYTNEMLQSVQKEIQKVVDRLKTSSPNMSMEDILKLAKEFVYTELSNNMRGVILGVLVGALLGTVSFRYIAQFVGASCDTVKSAGVGGAIVGGVIVGGAIVGGAIGGFLGAGKSGK